VNKTKITLIAIGVIIGLIALSFAFEALDIVRFGIFEPKRENIKREVFENTKSYVHGVIQDLGKYYEEYQKAETMDDKEVIASVIKMRFAEFDSSKIKSSPLRQFFINVRGY